MPMTTAAKRIILFPQDKGGIGKSFVATLLYDYLRDEGLRVKALDLDQANSTFRRFVPEGRVGLVEIQGFHPQAFVAQVVVKEGGDKALADAALVLGKEDDALGRGGHRHGLVVIAGDFAPTVGAGIRDRHGRRTDFRCGWRRNISGQLPTAAREFGRRKG